MDALNRTNQFFFDAVGLLTNTTFADGLFESYSYDAEGRRTNRLDRANHTTGYTYDSAGRLRRTTFADTSYTENGYDAAGRLTASVQAPVQPGGFTPPLGNLITSYQYNAAGQRTNVVNALDEPTCFAYDANGNQTNLVDALGRTNRFEFDALNRQVKMIYPDNTSERTGYDALGRRIAATNQADVITRFGYDALGRLTAVTNALGTSQQMVTRFDYDEHGNLLRQIDALNRTNKFEHDALGRRTKETLPQGQSQTFGYDAVGNLRFHTNFNSVILTNQYDLLNRLTNKASTGYTVSFAYNATGMRTNMVDASGTTSYTYDTRDRLLTKTTPQGRLNYTYNDYGNLATISSTTSNGVSLAYGYDELNRLTNAAAGAPNVGSASYTFDAVGNLQTVRLGNAVTNTYSYNSLNRLTNLVTKAASGTLATFAYQLAAAGNRTNLSESINTVARTNTWSYDALYRLTNEVIQGSSPTGTISYKYDAVGNRTNRTSSVSGVTNQTFTYSGNDWLTTDACDANGNTRTNGANTYGYNVENQLTNSTTSGTNIVMVYNGDGLRVAKTVGSTTTLYLLDDRNPTGYAQVLEELTVSGGVTNLGKVFTYGLDLISQRQAGSGTTHYYGHDGNGNVRYLTDTNATISDTYAYEAFGTQIASTGSTPNDYRYSGEQFDPNLGFTYLRARYLNPGIGRFWTRDSYAGTVFDPPSLHRYSYCLNNPVNSVDPSGRDSLSAAINGQIVHRKIAEHFINTVPGGISGPSISTVLTLAVTRIALFPDLIDVPRKKLFEIKPILSYPLGVAQLAGYISVFNYFDPAGGWTAGSEIDYFPPTRIELGLGSWAIVYPPDVGVILYDVIDIPSLALVTVGVAYSIQSQVSIASLNAQLGFAL